MKSRYMMLINQNCSKQLCVETDMQHLTKKEKPDLFEKNILRLLRTQFCKKTHESCHDQT